MATMQAFQRADAAEPRSDDGCRCPEWTDAAPRWRPDPLGADEASDEVVVTTTRRLLRLTTAAADVAARFVREGASRDPIEWMTVPRRLFGGGTAMDACQELAGFERSVVLHGLGLDADAVSVDVDWMLSGDAEHPGAAIAPGVWVEPSTSTGPRLLSCWVTAAGQRGRLLAFCAMVTERPADLMERVRRRYGAEAASAADLTIGFDRDNAFVDAMIGEAVIDKLMLAAAHPRSPAARGLDVVIEQRFAA